MKIWDSVYICGLNFKMSFKSYPKNECGIDPVKVKIPSRLTCNATEEISSKNLLCFQPFAIGMKGCEERVLIENERILCMVLRERAENFWLLRLRKILGGRSQGHFYLFRP